MKIASPKAKGSGDKKSPIF